MRNVPSPSVAPGFDVDVYLVLDDFAELGRAYRETDEEKANRGSVIRALLSGQFNHPVRIVAFNTAAGWSRDVTKGIAREINEMAKREGKELSPGLRDFIAYELEVK
jgi:hypothetical protein